MKSNTEGSRAVDVYIATFPKETQERLEAMRATIRAAAPDAEEKISYQMPAFTLEGNLVYFAAQRAYIGFYPTSSGVEAFKQELSAYEGTKGSIHFPFDQPLPTELISRIVRFRVDENLARAAAKSHKRNG